MQRAVASIVIPARFASKRFPGKPLAAVRGAGGLSKPLIQRSYEAACQVGGVASVHIATDDERIGQAAQRFGASVIYTPANCANGTERIAAALADVPDASEIIVNFQGDALLTPPAFVAFLIEHMRLHPGCDVSTVAVRCSASAYCHLVADQAAGRSGGTTVVVNAKGEAMYFSKRVIPYVPDDHIADDVPVLMHLGLYAYRREALRNYAAAAPAPTEELEGLEQLRFLHNGVPVEVLVCDAPEWDVIELNNPSDLAVIEAILVNRGIA